MAERSGTHLPFPALAPGSNLVVKDSHWQIGIPRYTIERKWLHV